MNWLIFISAFLLSLFGIFLLWHMPLIPKITLKPTQKISVIVPARNEEQRILPLLNSLQNQLSFIHELIVVDDHSTDQTANIAKGYGAKVIQAEPLPKGWFGKPWACYQGAKVASGDILLFLDADVVLMPHGIPSIYHTFQKNRTPLSIQPFHKTHKPFESLSLFFNLIVMMTTGLFTPFGTKRKAHSFFGPCQMVTKEDYWKIDGHASAKHAILEDMALGQAYQNQLKKPVRALTGKGVIYFRMYPEGLASLIEGWTKNFATGASLISPPLLTFVSLWITGLFITFLSGLAPFMWQDQVYVLGYVVMGLETYFLARKVGNFSPFTIVLYPVYLIFFVGLFIRSSFQSKKKKVTWKGRDLEL